MEQRENVFVYGTLLNQSVRYNVAQNEVEVIKENVILANYRKEGLNIVEAKGFFVSGIILSVTQKGLAMLDNYESIDYGLYHKIEVELLTSTGTEKAIAYQLTSEM